MPTYPTWDYVPVIHDFMYTAEIAWPGLVGEQLDWIVGISHVEFWLNQYTGPKYQRWAWNMAWRATIYQWPLSLTNTAPCSYSITAEGGAKIFYREAKAVKTRY